MRSQGIEVQQGEVAALLGIPAAGVDVVDVAKAHRHPHRSVAHHQGGEIRDPALVQPFDTAP